eukprot:gene21117-28008_t
MSQDKEHMNTPSAQRAEQEVDRASAAPLPMDRDSPSAQRAEQEEDRASAAASPMDRESPSAQRGQQLPDNFATAAEPLDRNRPAARRRQQEGGQGSIPNTPASMDRESPSAQRGQQQPDRFATATMPIDRDSPLAQRRQQEGGQATIPNTPTPMDRESPAEQRGQQEGGQGSIPARPMVEQEGGRRPIPTAPTPLGSNPPSAQNVEQQEGRTSTPSTRMAGHSPSAHGLTAAGGSKPSGDEEHRDSPRRHAALDQQLTALVGKMSGVVLPMPTDSKEDCNQEGIQLAESKLAWVHESEGSETKTSSMGPEKDKNPTHPERTQRPRFSRRLILCLIVVTLTAALAIGLSIALPILLQSSQSDRIIETRPFLVVIKEEGERPLLVSQSLVQGPDPKEVVSHRKAKEDAATIGSLFDEVTDDTLVNVFSLYVKSFKKEYITDEEAGLNGYSDLDDEEFESDVLMKVTQGKKPPNAEDRPDPPPLPSSPPPPPSPHPPVPEKIHPPAPTPPSYPPTLSLVDTQYPPTPPKFYLPMPVPRYPPTPAYAPVYPPLPNNGMATSPPPIPPNSEARGPSPPPPHEDPPPLGKGDGSYGLHPPPPPPTEESNARRLLGLNQSFPAYPQHMSWVDRQMTTPVRDQHLVDCVNPDQGFYGYACDGGWSDEAINFVGTYGQVFENLWPYQNTNQSCPTNFLNKDKPTVFNNKGVQLGNASTNYYGPCSSVTLSPFNNVSVIMKAIQIQIHLLLQLSPFNNVSVIMKALQNHAMMLVGYNVSDPENPYWITQNSWGTSWGEKGFGSPPSPPNPPPNFVCDYEVSERHSRCANTVVEIKGVPSPRDCARQCSIRTPVPTTLCFSHNFILGTCTCADGPESSIFDFDWEKYLYKCSYPPPPPAPPAPPRPPPTPFTCSFELVQANAWCSRSRGTYGLYSVEDCANFCYESSGFVSPMCFDYRAQSTHCECSTGPDVAQPQPGYMAYSLTCNSKPPTPPPPPPAIHFSPALCGVNYRLTHKTCADPVIRVPNSDFSTASECGLHCALEGLEAPFCVSFKADERQHRLSDDGVPMS